MTAFTHSLAVGIDAHGHAIPQLTTAVGEVSIMIGSGRAGWMGWLGPICAPVSARRPRRYGCATLSWTGIGWGVTPSGWTNGRPRSASVICSNCLA